MDESRQPILVSGFFETMGEPQISFLKEAAKLGPLYVCISNDDTILAYCGRPPLMPSAERVSAARSIEGVEDAFIAKGFGRLDFKFDLINRGYAKYVIDAERNHPDKRRTCSLLNIDYIVINKTWDGEVDEMPLSRLFRFN